MLRTDSREHLSFQKPCPRNTCRSMKFVGTLARHPQPKFGVSGRVAIADAYEPVIRDRIVQLFRQRSDAYKNLAQSGMATCARFRSSLKTPTRLVASVLAVPHFDAGRNTLDMFFFCEQVKDSVH